MDLDTALRQSIERICGVAPDDVSASSTLDELGIDSLAAAELITDLEIRLGLELPVDVLRRMSRLETVGDVEEYLEAALGAAPSGG